jgi:sterol desaturase/sphingolipid hydroxylase (fatty acid hydroxylase superfamily)
MTVLNTVIVRILFPTAAVGFATFADTNNWGLLHLLQLPELAAIGLAILALDLTIYLQHVLFHAAPSLWRLHRMHHADLDFDVTTGLRFHPVEIVLSMGIKFVIIAALGAPAVAVLVFEVLLNGTSMFNHANLKLPTAADRLLRRLIVTPDMHRVHHSITASETNSNFGFNLSWWDHIFGTYRAQPARGHEAMIIGIDQFRSARDQRLDRMLVQPFIGPYGAYPFGNREKS